MGIFTYLITKTDLGRAQRACEQDRTMTALLGINVDRTISITFIIGSSLASVAGMMFVLYYGVIDFYIGFLAGIKAFTAAVLRRNWIIAWSNVRWIVNWTYRNLLGWICFT